MLAVVYSEHGFVVGQVHHENTYKVQLLLIPGDHPLVTEMVGSRGETMSWRGPGLVPAALCQATVDVSAPSNLAAVPQLAAATPAQHHPAPPFINKPYQGSTTSRYLVSHRSGGFMQF